MTTEEIKEGLENEIEKKTEDSSRELIKEIFEEMEDLVDPEPKDKPKEVAIQEKPEGSGSGALGRGLGTRSSVEGREVDVEEFSRVANEVVEELYRTTMELVNRKLARYVLRRVLERLE